MTMPPHSPDEPDSNIISMDDGIVALNAWARHLLSSVRRGIRQAENPQHLYPKAKKMHALFIQTIELAKEENLLFVVEIIVVLEEARECIEGIMSEINTKTGRINEGKIESLSLFMLKTLNEIEPADTTDTGN